MVAYGMRSRTRRSGVGRKLRSQAKAKSIKKLARRVPKAIKAYVKNTILSKAETKKTVSVNSTRANLLHNGLVQLDATPLKTSQGVTDPDVSGTLNNRIGDQVIPVGLSIKFMVCLDPRQQHVHCRWMLIKSAAGDVPSISTLFCGATDNKRLDSIDTERYNIIRQKFFTVRRPNPSIGGTDYTMNSVLNALEPTGNYVTAGAQDQSYASNPISIWIPGKVFGNTLQYNSGSQSPKMYQYTSLILCYTSFKATSVGTITTGTPLGLMEDYVSKFYFKDM